MNLPRIVSPQEWQIAHEELLAKEKAMSRALAALAAERRRQPMVAFDKEYVFATPEGGRATLIDMFEGRRQLIIYQFMMEAGADFRCPGCSAVADNIPHNAHLHARDTTFALVSPAPQDQIQEYRQRMGWDLKWYSSLDNDFNEDTGVGSGFGLSVFLRDGDRAFRTYFTTRRGVEILRNDLLLLDLTPLGRQETWEDSPEGRPQTPPYEWWRLHDEY